jgi:hypothetical protein
MGIDVNETSVYAMWTMQLTQCLQTISNAVVNATNDLIVPNQPVPDWVWTLPPAVANEKARYVKMYGSPNVFDQFSPHVTLGTDPVTPERLVSIAAESGFRRLVQQINMTVSTVALGTVGPFGTVMRGKDLAVFSLN